MPEAASPKAFYAGGSFLSGEPPSSEVTRENLHFTERLNLLV
jgi:hypothetical protein